MSGAHGHIDPSNKKIALLISVLALVLAFSETLGKAAQASGLSFNIEASNLWAFFQAKTGEGRTELAARAKEAEKKRNRAMALAWIAGALGAIGIVFCAIGFFAPTAVHLF